MTLRSVTCAIVFAGSLLLGCASTPRRQEERPKRVSDSAPDKVAATRSAAGLHLEEEDNRWGIDAARARKESAETRGQPARPSTDLKVAAPVAQP